MVLLRLSISRGSAPKIVARFPCCARCGKGVSGLVGDRDGGGGSGKGFERLFCRLRLRAWFDGGRPEGRTGRGADPAGLSIVGMSDSEGRRTMIWEGFRVSRAKSSLPGVIFLIPRKAEEKISDEVLDSDGPSVSESESRLTSLRPACCWPGLPNVSPDPDIVYA
jgi:hypothetical protein